MPQAKSTQPAGQAPPAKKRRKLTEQEKKAQADEKAAKEAEREKKRKEKEAEAEKKKLESEKKKAEAEKRKAETEKKKAETERKKREKEEEAERKQRAQPKIGSFFTKQPLTSNLKTDLPVGARSPSPAAQERNEYQRLAQEFFVKENVTLASNKFALSPNSQATKVAMLDDFVTGTRAPLEIQTSKSIQALGLPNGFTHHPRGKIYPSVRALFSSHDGLQTSPIDLTTESQNLRIQNTQQALRQIPLKHLKFHEDVRPAYYGTATSVESLASLRKLAKNPIAKDLPLNYDYDSEAEWVDGGDDGEGDDVSLMDEDDVDEEDGEAMDDFLDDSEDAGRGPRMMAGTLEPESSGVCFEDRTRKNPNPQMYKFRMEFMIPNLKHHHSVDPFSDQYWVQEPKTTSTKSSAHGTADKVADGAMAPPPVPFGFAALGATSAATTSNPPAPQDLVPAAQLDSFKAAVLEYSFMPKTAMVATLKKKLDNCTTAQIKATLDHVAEKPSKKGDWKIKSGM